MNKLQLISASDLDEYIFRSDVLLVDVRSPEDYENMHIRSAINIPYGPEMKNWKVRGGKRIIFYCQHGSGSMMAARDLLKRGYDAGTVIGGISEYKGRNLVFSRQS